MHVFYQPDLSGSTILLSEEESKHCIRVLRMNKGDEVHLADGKGMHAIAVIADDHPKKCSLEIIRKETTTPSRNYYLHMLVAPVKNAERTEWFIEKATEAGIDEITFITTANSEREKVNMDRCIKIAVSAMKQSKQWTLPVINPPVNFSEISRYIQPESLKLMAWCETGAEAFIQKELSGYAVKNTTRHTVNILIGPEGDFTAHEVEAAAKMGFIPVSLGNNILRTETAALFACMAVKTLL